MIEGTVFKILGGYFFVRAGEDEYRCYLRGRFRQRDQVLVGDLVSFAPGDQGTGMVEKIHPRKTRLYRPPVANVDTALIVFSTCKPSPNLLLLDRFLLQSEMAGVRPVVCLNKADLTDPSELVTLYEQATYKVLVTSALTKQGIPLLNKFLKDRISVLAGPSGVGKSSLLNVVEPGLGLKTGTISKKLQKGKHTTRHVELLRLQNGGFVVDTPGFSNLHLPPELAGENLAAYFPDLEQETPACRFSGCLHLKEPGCAVKEAVNEGRIAKSRYQNYTSLLNEVFRQERRN